MEYQKLRNLLDNAPNQPSKVKTKNWIEIKDESRGTYNKDNQIRFKTSMLSSLLCDYSNSYIPVKATITVKNKATQVQRNNAGNKKLIFSNCLTYTSCISRIKNTQVDDAHDVNIVVAMYNLIEYSHSYPNLSWFYGNIVEMNQL